MTYFDLRSAKLRSGEEYRAEQQVELEPLQLGGQRYLPVPENVAADFRMIRASSGYVFELGFAARLHGPCYRCLTDAVIDLPISAREYQSTATDAAEDLRTPYLRDSRLDVSSWARDALALDLPDKILCRPDCAGLCPMCGRDLNVEPHEHEEERTDSRWAALAELRDRL